MSSEAELLIRLTGVLAQRDVPIEPVLEAIQAGGTMSTFIAVEAFSNRIALLIPSTPGAFKALRPDLEVPDVPISVMWSVEIDGDQFRVGVLISDRRGPRETVEELLPAGVREAWLSTIDSLLGFGGASMMNFTRFYTEPRASMAFQYPPREGELEEQFVRGIQGVAARVGVSAEQRALWETIYPLAAANVGLSVSTSCTPRGVQPTLEIRYGASTWDRTINVTNSIVGRTSVEAREAAARFGMLSGALEIEEPRGLGIVLDAGARPDVMVWLAPR